MTGAIDLKAGETSLKGFNVLITGVGSPGAVGIIQYLRKFYGVVGVDKEYDVAGRIFCDAFFTVPPASSPDFIPVLKEICINNGIRIIFPKVSAELDKLSKAAKEFDKLGIKIIISEYKGLRVAENKYLLYSKFPEYSPKFFKSDKFCSKPIRGSGGDGFRCYTAEKALVSDFLPGDEYSVDVLADGGFSVTICVRVRVKTKAGVSVDGVVVKDVEIEKITADIVKRLKLHGIVGFQFKRDANGKPKLLECNPRIQGSIMLSEASGANMFVNAVNIAVGNETEHTEIKEGTRMLRYLKEIYI